MIPLVVGTLMLLFVALLAAAVGHRLLRILHGPCLCGAERGVWAIALGMGALSYLPFLLFSVGLGRPMGIRIGVLALSFALLPDIRHVMRGGWRWLRTLQYWSRPKQGLFALLSLLLFALYLRALCPPTIGDALAYHLTAALRYLQVGHFRYLPTIVYTNWPLGVQMHYALLLGLNPHTPPAVVQFLFGLLLVALLYLMAERFMGSAAGISVICLLILADNFSSGGIWYQMMAAMVDLGLTLYLTCAVFAAYRAVTETRLKPEWLRISALFAGLAATTKLTGLWVIVSVAIALLLALYRDGFKQALQRTVVYCLIAAAVVAPWFVKTWVLTGNPFYPMFYKQLGGIEWTAQGWARFEHSHMEWNTPAGKLPTPELLRTVHLQIALMGVCIGLAVVWLARRSRYALILQAAILFCACICVANYLHPRFLMPAFPCLLICLAALLRGRRVVIALICLSVLTAAQASRRQWDPTLIEAGRVAIGRISIDDYMRSHVKEWDLIQYANRHLPQNARILLSGYDYKPALYRAESLWPDYGLQDSIHYDSPARLDSDLRRLGVGYLVLNTVFPDWCERSHHCRERKETELLPTIALAQRHGRLLFQSNNYQLYALHF